MHARDGIRGSGRWYLSNRVEICTSAQGVLLHASQVQLMCGRKTACVRVDGVRTRGELWASAPGTVCLHARRIVWMGIV